MEDDIKVLVVDDNLINRRVTSQLLRGYGFDTAEAEGGAQAVEMVRQTRFGLIFMDYMMPEMDGVETLRAIRRECGENGRTPVVVALTAETEEADGKLFLQNGFQDFLVKPLNVEPLELILKRWGLLDADKINSAEYADTENGLTDETLQEDIRIPGIDMAEAGKYRGGSAKDYLELLELYLLDGRRKLPFLARLLEEEDYRNYEIEVHALKSASARLGAAELSARAREHEAAAKRGDTDFIKKDCADLLSAYETLLGEIGAYLEKTRSGPPREEQKRSERRIDSDELIRQARSALESVEDFRSRECAQRIDELLEYRLDRDTQTRLKEVRERLRIYRDDEAERLLRELLELLENENRRA